MKDQAGRRILGVILLLVGCGVCFTSTAPRQELTGWAKGEPWLPAYFAQAMPVLVGSLIVLFGVIVLAWKANPYRRYRSGRCQHCSYDLSGLRSGTGCPECGTTT